MSGSLNLARVPFVNRRPLRRTARALLVLGLLLTIVNGFLFARYLLSSADLRGQLRDVRAAIAAEQEGIERAGQQLASFDLQSQNERVEFLNARIAERTFAWSRLFEELGEVLPLGVRLRQLTPVLEQVRGGRGGPETVELSITGQARNGDDLLALVDSLFAHPAFERPRLTSESRTGSLIDFVLGVRYRTERSDEQETAAEPAGEEPSDLVGTEEESDTAPATGAVAATPLPVGATDAEVLPDTRSTPRLVAPAPGGDATPASRARNDSPEETGPTAMASPGPSTGDAGAAASPRSPAVFVPAVPPTTGAGTAPPTPGGDRRPPATPATGSGTSSPSSPPGGAPPLGPRPNASAPPGGGR